MRNPKINRPILYTVLLCFLLPAHLVFPFTENGAEETSRTVSLVGNAITDAILGRPASLWKRYRREELKARHSPRQTSPDLAPNLLALYASGIDDRDLFIGWQRKLRHRRTDPFLKSSTLNYISRDELLCARRLLRHNRYNHFTGALNHTSAAVSSLLQGQTQPLFQLPIDFAYALHSLKEASPRQRKSLFLLKRFGGKYPDPVRQKKLKPLIEKLGKRRRKQIFENDYRLGKISRKNKNLHRALFHFRNALSTNPHSKKVKKQIRQIESELMRQKRNRRATMAVLDGENFFFSLDEKRAYKGIVTALAAGEPDTLLEHISLFEKDYARSNYIDDAEYAATTIPDPQKNWCDVLYLLRNLEKKYPDTNSARYAAAALCDPNFNPSLDIKNAKHILSADLRKYILLGKRKPEEQLYIASSGVVQSSTYAPENLGILYVIDIAVRGVKSIFSHPIPPDALIEAASRYERIYPDDPDSTHMCELLARLYARKHLYARALIYAHRAGTFHPRYLRKLSNRHARKLYILINRLTNPQQKIRNLERLIAQFPDAPIIKKARRDLGKLSLESIYEFSISKKELEVYPDLWRKTALSLAPAFFDGKKRNGELTDDGIKVLKNGPVLYHLKGIKVAYEIDITPAQRKMIRTRLDALRTGSTYLEAVHKKTERPFPLEISGGIGTRGFEAYPAFHPIEYRSGDLELFR